MICKTVDITNRNDIYANAKIINEKFGGVDFLINNAGLINLGSFLEIPDEKIDNLFDVNIKAIFWVQ